MYRSPFNSDRKPQPPEFNALEAINKISGNQEAIILFELFPLSRASELNSFIKDKLGKEIFRFEERFAKGVFQANEEIIKIQNSITNVEKIAISVTYHFGEYIQIAFICLLKRYQFKDFKSTNPDISSRNKYLENLQREIESWIPPDLHGYFFENELKFFGRGFYLPSIYVYNAYEFGSNLLEPPSSPNYVLVGASTPRSRADSFISKFRTGELDERFSKNYLTSIGAFPELLLSTFKERFIVMCSTKFFEYPYGRHYSNYIWLNFLERGSLVQSEDARLFIAEFGIMLHLDAVFRKLELDLGEIVIPPFDRIGGERKLLELKLDAISLTNRLNKLNEIYLEYNGDPANIIRGSGNFFSNEETFIASFLERNSYHEESITDHFRQPIRRVMDKINQVLQNKKETLNGYLALLNAEMQLRAQRVTVSSPFRDIEEDLVKQIENFKGSISQSQIQDWLLNFDTKEDMLTALLLLSQVRFVTFDDLRSLCKALHNRISYHLQDIPIKQRRFSYIGSVTSGSAHILKIFRDENNIPDHLFVTPEELEKENDTNITVVFLDDFVGAGNFFSDWYKQWNSKVSKFKSPYLGALYAFEEGIGKIAESGITTLYGKLYETKFKVLEGDLFKPEEKQRIKNLVQKYSDRLPKNYLWGRDNCQLLVAFYSNIPNNSLAILWSSNYWTPLIQRK